MPNRAEYFHALIRGEPRGPAAWLLRCGLWWARLPYAAAIAWRNRRYDRGDWPTYRAAVPVVSVGNLTLGGTGKTPCVEYVATYYREQEVRVALLSRGYGSKTGLNDEGLLLEENLPDVPHLQGRDRAVLAQTAVEELESELLLLDDGFQHRRLHRDLDIVLLDATRPVDEEYHFPRGLLRESTGGLRRAHFAIMTHCDRATADSRIRQQQWLATRYPNLPWATAIHEPRGWHGLAGPESTAAWSNTRVAAFCGIAQPESFRQSLASLQLELAAWRTFPDHHNYTRDDVDDLTRWAAALPTSTRVVTTQKDWVKLRLDELGGRPLRYLRVGLRFLEGEARFRAALQSVVREPRPEPADAEFGGEG